MKKQSAVCLSFFILFFNTQILFSQEIQNNPDSNPLSDFEQLIGGEWHQDSGYQIFHWGVGKKSVIGENYIMMDGQTEKVSQGVWFWHPGEQKIKGYFTAINMPVEFFDYTTRFTDDGIESDLLAYDSMENQFRYFEKWVFVDKNQIRWTLYSIQNDEKMQIMQGVLTR